MPTVEAFSVCVPSVTEQREIADALEADLSMAETIWSTVAAELAGINALPAALLRRAFSGEL